jgi:DNA-binding response OmpR family regulator
MKHANAKILIADDEQAITSGLSAILADEGYAIDIAPDGQKALERLSEDRYGVILADLKMPKLDGLSLLRELQAKQIPTECIIITGQATGGLGGAGDAAGRV